MHILVTNDDGPPSAHASPYVHCLIRHLQAAGHTVSVCLPDTQRSWIGKAHMIGKTVKPVYYRPSKAQPTDQEEGTRHALPSPEGSGEEEWVLVDGTPASCVQIGLHHYFKDRGPVDLVVSGPNYGRNTTAVFALSSGTLGAALEAAACRARSIAVSFAFFSRNHDPEIIEAACAHSVRVIHALYEQWPTDRSVDLYSVNVPLVEGVGKNKTLFTDILQNYWSGSSCFQEIEGEAGEAHIEEEAIREGRGGKENGTSKLATNHKHKHFKWAPSFEDVYQSVEESGPGNDGWVVRQGQTSVTPMKANFATTIRAEDAKELELKPTTSAKDPVTQSLPIRPARDGASGIEAIVCYGDDYVQPLILSAMESVFPAGLVSQRTEMPSSLSQVVASSTASEPRILAITQYEDVDFEFAAEHNKTCMVNSYMIRKALIRKHHLSTTVDHWVAKKPESLLKQHTKRSEAFEVDYAEFLDDALVEAFDLRESMYRNAKVEDADQREWWILKPGMSDGGQGIRLFSTMEELQDIFDRWEPESDVDEDENDGSGEGGEGGEGKSGGGGGGGDTIMASHLRHFVAQPYIHPPLLLPNDGRKFHIRTYVCCTGSLKVYVYRHMLALFAGKPYVAPGTEAEPDSYLTNTCLQTTDDNGDTRSNVSRFWDLAKDQQTGPGIPSERLESLFRQVCGVSGEVFEAAARAMPIHFQTSPNVFEVFGLDFLVDADYEAWLLEVNAFPDFKQTGSDLSDIVGGLWEGVLRCAVAPFLLRPDELEQVKNSQKDDDGMVLVKDIDLGRG
ncbi:Tubulin-tyrosine ligase family [Geosmithia morbida]|uniref:Tubulin-tyrosine ligase family n=1 Tax=Geosmithia morbida TaxID=1094350 RepID=A0A9P5D2Y6_9HYPO|nr:Tubulin-tyrosine ligase family [Geosmithia morbida]KAF4124367.1 Tubulin-tyrosine ligase family [Geosmithia morbida]